ncbi:hypothetical protein HU200_063397 [Digitaria exilis]|uniref:GHMP kinase C-terminal domain-containing protein n=1 Tax=Digitaria exilis TaxID=1010633 RepID=A0A835DVA5_9POAL|nr:hypothetical protein HU200_063397 [Digitaria exilis]
MVAPVAREGGPSRWPGGGRGEAGAYVPAGSDSHVALLVKPHASAGSDLKSFFVTQNIVLIVNTLPIKFSCAIWQGGIVMAMTINYGVLLGFVPSNDSEVLLQSGQFEGVIRFRIVDMISGRVIIGYISGVKGLDSSGLSSSAAGWHCLFAGFRNVNDLVISSVDNIQLDKSIENKYLGLENGILDPSAILLSRYGCLTFMDWQGLQHNLPKKCGYNTRVFECKEAARALLHASGCEEASNILRNVDSVVYEAHKCVLEENLSRRAEHYFSEMKRVAKGELITCRDAWARGNLQELGQLISASGRSSILNYECGSKEMIQLYEILLKAPGVLGARFSGAGFRGCCLAIVESDRAEEAAAYVAAEYEKAQPELVSRIPANRRVLVCEPGDSARVILPDGDRLRS